MSDDDDLNSLPHTGSPTSAGAATAFKRKAISLRVQTLRRLVRLEPDGSTPDENQVAFGVGHQSNSPRFSELEDDGLITFDESTRPTRSGCPATVWRPTPLAISLVEKGLYDGARISKEKRESRIAVMHTLFNKAIAGWAASTTAPADLDQIERLTKQAALCMRRR